MKLFLVRHGESEGNKLRLSQGHYDFDLTEKGIIESQKVANRLKDEKIEYVYSSDLKRCKKTTDEILKFHTNVDREYLFSLREQSKGTFENSPKENINNQIVKDNVPYYKFKPNDGESLIDVYERMEQFYNKLQLNLKSKNVLVVSHGGPITCLLLHIFNKPIEEYQQFLPKSNTAVSIIEFNEFGKNVISLLDSKHLD